LDLPPPRESSESLRHRYRDYPTAGLSPQDITDRRVDARNERNNLEFEHELSFSDLAGPNALGVTENYLPMASEQELQEKLLNAGKLANAPYDPYYGSGEYQSELRDGMQDAKETEEAYEHAQRRLDQQTMTREGQQGEADEMDAMGVPDMGRSVGGRAPPNVGRAGNSQMTFPSHSLTAEEIEGGLDDLTPPNPFPKPTMKSLDVAWSLLKALTEQQMGYDDEGMQWNRTMHPAIQGLLSRTEPGMGMQQASPATGRTPSPYDFSAVGGDPSAYIQNLPGHPAEYRYNPKEQGESFRREPHQYPKEGQRVASPEEMKRVSSQNMQSLFGHDDGSTPDFTELLPETYKERNARIWQEHQARENAPFVEPAERSGFSGSGRSLDSYRTPDPAEQAFTTLQEIQDRGLQQKHPLGDFDTSNDLPEAIMARNKQRRRANIDAGYDIEDMFRAANRISQENLGVQEGDEDYQFHAPGREHRAGYFDEDPPFMEPYISHFE